MNHIMFAIFRKFRSKQLDCLRFLEINQSADTSTKKQTNNCNGKNIRVFLCGSLKALSRQWRPLKIKNKNNKSGAAVTVPHLRLKFEQCGCGRWTVDGPVAPGGSQTHNMVAVHVGQEEEPSVRTLPNLPEVYSQRCVRNNFAVDRHPPQVDPETTWFNGELSAR